jgi:transcriptional regulator with XRE-family HTH domain
MDTIQDRIRMIIKMHNLNSSGFADKIGVQRSSLSHILSGRNKPSLDFLEKTLAAFPRVNGDWLITGQMPKATTIGSGEVKTVQSSPMENSASSSKKTPGAAKKEIESGNTERKIVKILVLYSDGTFEEVESV